MYFNNKSNEKLNKVTKKRNKDVEQFSSLKKIARKNLSLVHSTPHFSKKPLTLKFNDNSVRFVEEYIVVEHADDLNLRPGSVERNTNIAQRGWEITPCNEKITPDKCNLTLEDKEFLAQQNEFSGENFGFLREVIKHNQTINVSALFETTSCDETNSNCSETIFQPIFVTKKNCEIIEPKIKFSNSDCTQLSETVVDSKDILNNTINSVVYNKTTQIYENDRPGNKAEPINISTKIKYYIGKTHCILVLRHPIKLYFQGKICVTVLSGAVEILGYILKSNPDLETDFYCPRGHCLLCIESIVSKTNTRIASILKNYSMTEAQIHGFCSTVNKNDCILAVRHLKNKMSDYLNRHVAQQLYPNVQQFDKRPLRSLEKKLRCQFELETASLKLYKKHEMWPNIVGTITQNNSSRTLFCGGKSVGKSTLLRYIINSLLNQLEKVAVIDLDPGQSEFSVGGCISVTIVDTPIFGPNYTHLKAPAVAYFVGDVNVMNCLNRYVKCVEVLIKYYEENVNQSLPLIINYMGFCKSIGLDLIIHTIKLLRPTNVIQLQSKSKGRNYLQELTPEFVTYYKPMFLLETPFCILNYSLTLLNSVAEQKVAGEWESEPRLLREMSILSYFSTILKQEEEITAAIPYW